MRMMGMLLLLWMIMIGGCRTAPSQHDATTDNSSSMKCETSLRQFEQRQFSDWQGLSPDCTPAVIAAYAGTNLEKYGQYWTGKEHLLTSFVMLTLKGYEEPVRLSFRDQRVVCLTVDFPKLDNVPVLLKALGKPNAPLDYYYDVMLNRSGEWVYNDRGITLFMNTARDNVVKLMVYPPILLDDYVREMYYFEPPREERGPKD